ncbi:MAG: cysteine desulfurase [Roseburia sp.]|nr:cysteine desulfurase [Roseburia sp.]
MIYLDNAATTPIYDCAIRAANDSMRNRYFNPNTTYSSGVGVRNDIERARRSIANAIGTASDELVFTSCATESNNWAINNGRKNIKGNIVVSAGEHASVYEPAAALASRGVDVRFVPLDRSGAIDISAFRAAVDEHTSLVSVIHVSNETGVINPIKQLVSIVRERAPRALFHSDGVQGLLKTDEPIKSLGVDLYSASAHKIGAPKGIGLLYIKKGVNIAPYILGGGQENGRRSGTQNTPYIAAFASAVENFKSLADNEKTSRLRSELARFFEERGCTVIGDGACSGYILCVCIPNVKAEILQNIVHDRGVIIGKGAACSGSKRGNRVLEAMKLNGKQIESCVRISLFTDTAPADAMEAAKIICDAAERIRRGNVG